MKMDNQDRPTETREALELDQLITAWQERKPERAPNAEQQLAEMLIRLADETTPDPLFVARLERQLRQAGLKKQSIQPKAAWLAFLTSKRNPIMFKKSIFAFAGVATLVLIIAVVWLQMGGPNNGGNEIAAIPVPTTQPGGVTEEVPLATAEPGSLPALPSLGNSGSGGPGGFGGGGGGGLESDSSAIVIDPGIDTELRPLYSPLSGTQYILNTILPIEPTSANVWQQPWSGLITPEDALRFAAQLGMSGELYTDIYPPVDVVDGQMAWTPPTFYYVFDGMKSLSVYDNNLYYNDQSVAPNYMFEQAPFAQAAPIAEAFLRERGFLNFDYRVVKSVWSEDVEIRRVVDGRLSTNAEFYVTVTVSGQVFAFSYNPLSRLSLLGNYPIRSAEEVWQELVNNGFNYGQMAYYNYPLTTTPTNSDDLVEGPYRYWAREYQDGEQIVVYSPPYAMRPVDGTGAARVMVDRFLVQASEEELQKMADNLNQQLYLVGTVRTPSPGQWILEVSQWQVAEAVEYQYLTGTIQRQADQVLLLAEDGQTILIPSAPADLADGERVNVNGWSIDAGNPYPIFNWQGIDRVVEETAWPTEAPIETELYAPYKIGQVTIDSVELVYYYMTYFAPYVEGQPADPGMVYLQPTWKFHGTTDTNEGVEILIQAVPTDYLQPTPTP